VRGARGATMANTELRLFRYFVTLSEEQNFARAAERLRITPPTLTHQIQKLEKDLDVRLLNRKTKMKLQLTDAGTRFLESARDVLHRAEEAEKNARKAARGEVGRLEIGYMIATVYTGAVQRLIGEFKAKHSGIDITLRQTSTVGLVNAIVASEIDVGFARVPTQYPLGLSGFPFYRAPIILALPSNHPLARKSGAIAPRALAREVFISTSVGYDLAFTRHVESVARLGGFTPAIGKCAEDLTTVLSYVSLGYGIAALSCDMANSALPNVTYKRIAARNAPEVAFAFMYRTNETAPAVRAFIESVREQVAKNGELRAD